MKKNIFAGIIILSSVTALFTMGCATIGESSSSDSPSSASNQGAAIAKVLKFDDVPAPAGFKLIDNESFTFQNDQIRVGLLKYSGSMDANKTVAFYKEQMPSYNWDLINAIEYGQKVMNFERRDQSCIITIQPMATKTVIVIAVAPKANTSMTQEKIQRLKELKPDRFEK